MPRFFVAMFSHETNTFSTIPTGRAEFESRNLRYGGELIETYRGTGTCLGGMIDTAAARGVALAPSIAAAASPSGRVTKEIFDDVKQRIVSDLRSGGPFDGILLDLHGAMVTDCAEDG